MADNYLVDTNAVSDLMDGIHSIQEITQSARILIPVIVLGELYFAYENGNRKKENHERFKLISQDWKVLEITQSTARVYAMLQMELKRKGKMIPLNDLWIAAVAIEHNLPLLSRDVHFEKFDNLKVVVWSQ